MPMPAENDHPYRTDDEAAVSLLSADARLVQPFLRVEATDPNARHVVVIRESQKWGTRLLRGMARQVLSRAVAAGVPGAAEVLAAVDADFLLWKREEGRAWREAHHARPLREPRGGRVYGYVFVVEGTTFVLAATSANAEDEEDLSNPFTTDLIELLEGGSFTHLITGPSSRLVRRKRFGEQLGAVFARQRLVVSTTEAGTIDFTGGQGFAGLGVSQHWSMICQFAEAEVKGILLRTTLGRINSVLNNCWPDGERSLPPHCMLGPGRELQLSADPAQLELARQYVRVAAEAFDRSRSATGEPMSDTDIVERLTERGATLHGSDRALTEASDHYRAVWSRFRWIGWMRSCSYRRTQVLPMDGLQADDVLGLDVWQEDRTDGSVREFLLFSWKLPALDGIDEETWDKAEAFFTAMRAPTPRKPGAGSKRHHLPLSRAFAGTLRSGDRVVLRANGANYEVRIIDAAGRLVPGKGPVASVPSAALHTKLVSAIEAAADGDRIALDDVVLPGAPPLDRTGTKKPSARQVELAAHRDQLEKQIGHDEAWLNHDRTAPSEKPAVQADVDAKREELTATVRELDDLDKVVQRQTGGQVPAARVRRLADLLAVLETADRWPASIQRMVLDLLDGPTVTAETWIPWITFTTRLRLRLTDGREVITTPVTFTTRNEARGQRTVGKKVFRDRFVRVLYPELLRMRCHGDGTGGEVTFDWIAERTEQSPRYVRSSLAGLLAGTAGRADQPVYKPVVANRQLAAAWVDAPATVRGVLYDITANRPAGLPWITSAWEDGAAEEKRPLPTSLPGLNKAETKVYLRVLGERYLTPGEEWTVNSWARGGERERRELAEAVRNSTVATVADAARTMGWAQTTTVATHLQDYARGRSYGALLELDPADPVDTPFAERTIRLRTCPTCGSDQLHVLTVPEIEGYVACRTCQRVLAAPGVKLPLFYFEWWEGPYGGRQRTRKSATDALGTRLGAAPLAATTQRQTRKRRIAGQNWRTTQTPTATCQIGRCDQTVARVSTSYCNDHQDRAARDRARIASQRPAAVCAFDGCQDPARPTAGGGRGRPPTYCNDHADGNHRRALRRGLNAAT